MPGCRGASSGGWGAGGTVGDRIWGLGVSGRWGGGGPGGPIPYGGGRNTGPYMTTIATARVLHVRPLMSGLGGSALEVFELEQRKANPPQLEGFRIRGSEACRCVTFVVQKILER